MAVVTLYYHVGTAEDFEKVVSPLMRLTKFKRENQYIVLTNLITLIKDRPEYFRSELNEFFVLSNDPHFIKILKLEILTLLVEENNSTKILKEFKVRFLFKKSPI
jgi:vesicle coat complex subunit